MMMKMQGATETDLFLNCTDMSVLDRQRAHLGFDSTLSGFDSSLAGFFADSSIINGGDTHGFPGLDIPAIESDTILSVSPEMITGSRKRKFDSDVAETKKKKKMMMNREEEEEEKSKITEENNKSIKKSMKSKKEQSNFSNDSSKVTNELQKTDYIHVRARRGQATDSHSLAERVRREKISERMKFLQDLVPGCSKITGKAGMLDEIINYVQSLQRQVEFLSMKLAVVNPRLDFDIDDIFPKEVVSAPMTNLPNTVMPPSHEMVNSGYLQFNDPMQQVVASSDPLSCFNNGQAPLMWNSDVQNLYSSLGV